MTRARDTSQTQNNGGGAVAPYVAGKNFLINGGFDIWQRGTTGTATAGVYTPADRWVTQNGSSVTISRQTTGVPTNSQYCLRVASNGSAQFGNMSQIIETANVAPMWGKTVTLQVKIRKNSSFTPNMVIYLQKSATVDATTSSTWVDVNFVTITNASLPSGITSTDWLTSSFPASVPSDGTANTLRVIVASDSTFNSGQYYETAQAQLEIGSVATPFSRAGGTLSGELAACQRYYWRQTAGVSFAILSLSGYGVSTTSAQVLIQFPITMRTAPGSLDSGGTQRLIDGTNSVAVTSLTSLLVNPSNQNTAITINTAGSLTQYRPYALSANNDLTAYIGFSAEL